MDTATNLLLLVGLLGAFDIAYFHNYRGRLLTRPESRREAWIHVVRGVVYALQFAIVPNVALHGRWYAALVALFVVDASVAIADVLEEPRSRESQGGLSGGEYLMHVVLSVLVGAMLHAIFSASWGWWSLPTELVREPHGGTIQRLLALCMAVGCALQAIGEGLILLSESLAPAAPLHVRVRLRAPLERVWNLTQDHRLHPAWDHRFSSITLLHEGDETWDERYAPEGTPDPRIRTGTLMRYEKRILGFALRGFGRYKLHKPMRQSTFEFWSDDPRSLIRRGVGLWLYTPLPGGLVEFSTSYTYDVRWGALGRVIDRFLFRPVFQRFTEQSFRRLARRWFPEGSTRVLGRTGRLPRRFDLAAERA